MPNKTKAEIRHAKLAAKAENAARKSLKNDKGINKIQRLVTKANKLNKRKNLGKDDIAYGMSPYKLKPVPADKQKSLGKLPADVRNKMGYQMAFTSDQFKTMGAAANNMKPYKMDSSHSFKMKAANNMKTMYMGSVYSMDDPKKGDYVVDENELKKIAGENIEIIPGQTRTETSKRDLTWNDLKAQGWSEEEINKAKKWREENPDVANVGVTETKTVKDPDTEKKTLDLGPLERQYQTGSNFQRRQQIRGVIQGERKEKRANIKVTGLENRLSKAKPGSIREKKLQAKLDAAKNKKARIGEINRQTQLQEEQGFIGPGSTSKQFFTPSVAGNTDRNTKTYGEQITKADADKMKNAINSISSIKFMKPMNLSPKAMNYFNRKNKK